MRRLPTDAQLRDLARELACTTNDQVLTELVRQVTDADRDRFLDIEWSSLFDASPTTNRKALRQRLSAGPPSTTELIEFEIGEFVQHHSPVASKKPGRAHLFRRIFGRLADADGITSGRTPRPFLPDDGVVVLTLAFEHADSGRVPLVGVTLIPNDPNRGTDLIPGRVVRQVEHEAADFARRGGWSLAVEWRALFDGELAGDLRPLPSDVDAAQALLHDMLQQAKAAIRPLIRRRMQFEVYLSYVAVFLLRYGHGELSGRSLTETARALVSAADTPDQANGPGADACRSLTNADLADEVQHVRNHLRAAGKLMQNWRRIGTA